MPKERKKAIRTEMHKYKPAKIVDFGDIEGELARWSHQHGYDWSLRCETAHHCMWSAELRITPEPNSPGADVSTVFFVGGGGDPLSPAVEALEAARAWHVKRLS
jgi:hypothetical protein